MPWGLGSLTSKEKKQVVLANDLLWYSIHLAAMASRTGALAIIEHPAEPIDQPGFCSIWKLPQNRQLLCNDTKIEL
eukprot:12895395-Prorocentrum_lima.AAC.1